MPRTVVYGLGQLRRELGVEQLPGVPLADKPPQPAHRRRRREEPGATTRPGDRGSTPEDTYQQKLVKYVPAEVLSGFLPLMVAAKQAGRTGLQWFVLAAGLLATPGYAFENARRERDPDKLPLPHFYILATAAFVMWALGTSPVAADLVGLKQQVGSVLLGITVFTLPWLDGWLTAATKALIRRTVERRKRRPQTETERSGAAR
jgi:hypothetical protein